MSSAGTVTEVLPPNSGYVFVVSTICRPGKACYIPEKHEFVGEFLTCQ